MKEAMLYAKQPENRVKCSLCAHRCAIGPSKRGICGVRENVDGTLYSLVYGRLVAENVDPIEKKPLFHFYPGSRSYSIAAMGCNFRCRFCQNHEISQMPHETGEIFGRDATPREVVERALRSGSRTISYTYTEPTIYFEFAYDTARLAQEKGLKNLFVTNGFMTEEALEVIAPCLDGANVDLKSFREEFYQKYCGAHLQPVLDSLRKMKALGLWVEITTLLIPDLNDTDEELTQIAGFIAALGTEIPWHISRFHPRYRMNDHAPTEVSTLHRAAQIGKSRGLKYVYCGNVPGDAGENTACANCGNSLIRRWSFTIEQNALKDGACPSCGKALDGVF